MSPADDSADASEPADRARATAGLVDPAGTDELSRGGILWNHWRVILAGSVVFAAGLFVPLPFEHRAAGAVGDLCHSPLFGGITWLCLRMLGRVDPIVGQPWSLAWRVAGVSAGVFTLGLLAEWGQVYSGRSAAWHDAVANGWGIAAAVVLYLSQNWNETDQPSGRGDRPGSSLWKWLGWVVAGAMVAVAWQGPLVVLSDVIGKHRSFPLLASFESEVELQRWFFRDAAPTLVTSESTPGKVPHGRYAVRMDLRPAEIAGATMFELSGNWSSMDRLQLKVCLDKGYQEPTADLLIKVADTEVADFQTDVFRKSFQIPRGRWETISIPRHELVSGPDDRELNLQEIRFLDLFLVESSEPVSLTIDDVRLTLDEAFNAE